MKKLTDYAWTEHEILERELSIVSWHTTKNPVCPYITAIHQNTAQVNRIEKALVGEDLQSGLVTKVHQLEVTQKILIALGSTSLVGLVSLAVILIEKLVVK